MTRERYIGMTGTELLQQLLPKASIEFYDDDESMDSSRRILITPAHFEERVPQMNLQQFADELEEFGVACDTHNMPRCFRVDENSLNARANDAETAEFAFGRKVQTLRDFLMLMLLAAHQTRSDNVTALQSWRKRPQGDGQIGR